MSNEELLEQIDVIAGLLHNPEPVDGVKNAQAYLEMLKKRLLNNE